MGDGLMKQLVQSTSEVAAAYDKWHARNGFEVGIPLQFPWYASVADHIGQDVRGDLLEVGCGRGEFALWLAETSPRAHVIRVDFSETAIEMARRRASGTSASLRFMVGDAQRLEFPDNSFDWVVSCECMEHVPSPPAMAAEIYRVLKPGGKFCLTTENYLNGMLVAWLYSWLTRRPFNSGSGVQPIEKFFLYLQVQGHLSRAGLKVAGTASSHYQWLLLPRIDPARLCTNGFQSSWARRIAKPFGRHFSFFGFKP
jgi:ubiquinone/menaquinone biosynthesis C-methylase UbiE